MIVSKGWRRFQRELGKPPLRMLPPYITPAKGESMFEEPRTFGRVGVAVVCGALLLYAVIAIVLHFKGVR